MTLRKVALDCMISPRFAEAMNALYKDQGYEFTLVQEMVPPGTSDTHWSDVFKRFGGKFVISGDTRIAYKPTLACSFVDNDFVSVFLQSPWQQIPFNLQIAHLVYWWPSFARHFAEVQAGTLWRAPCGYTSGTLRLKEAPLKQLKVPEHVLQRERARRSQNPA